MEVRSHLQTRTKANKSGLPPTQVNERIQDGERETKLKNGKLQHQTNETLIIIMENLMEGEWEEDVTEEEEA